MKSTKWSVSLKRNLDDFIFKTFYSKVKKTETNIKRVDRFKITVSFILFQIIIISLFAVFGISDTKQLTYENTIEVTGHLDDYSHIEFHIRRSFLHYYNLWIDGNKYKLNVDNTTCNYMQDIVQGNNEITFRYYDRIFSNDIVEFEFDDTELTSLNGFNSSQKALRIMFIILFSLIELIFVTTYVIYIVFHRTSKDKRWL